jgi:hypothetical protein
MLQEQETEIIGQTSQLTGPMIRTEDASYHSIKIYNMIRDQLWNYLATINKVNDLQSCIEITDDIRVLLLRGDKVWSEIQKAANEKARGLRIREKVLDYKGSLRLLALELSMYLAYEKEKEAYYQSNDVNFFNYIQLPITSKIEFYKKKVEEVVNKADEDWGTYAAQINFTMPIELRAEQDPFFRHR